jgi:rod shape-determining protein MreD
VSTTIGLLLVLAAVLAQAAVIPAFSIFGAQPNAVLVLLVAWMSVRGRREALVLIPAAGFAQGLIDSQELGVAMLALAPLILMTTVRDMRLVESDLVPALAITAIGTLVYETVVLLTLALRGEHLDWLASTTDVLVPATIANVLLLLPLYGVLRLASPEPRHRPAY